MPAYVPSAEEIKSRTLRYSDLIPCKTAFIDARTPGSDKKENFCLVGEGVAENPGQVVHIKIKHPFDVGAARQPRGCKNSHHSHDTAEVFVVHSGEWKFTWGHEGGDGEAILTAGDTITLPIHMFRGFENVGDDNGFLYCILGLNQQHSAGHVTWAPYVFENAKDHGLVLLEDGRLIDTLEGMEVPEGAELMAATTEADLVKYKHVSLEEMAKYVVTSEQLPSQQQAGLSSIEGVSEYAILGYASDDEGFDASESNWRHGFAMRRMVIEQGAKVPTHTRAEEEVLFVQSGELTIHCGGETVTLAAGDLFTVPVNAERSFENVGNVAVDVVVTRGADAPSAAVFS